MSKEVLEQPDFSTFHDPETITSIISSHDQGWDAVFGVQQFPQHMERKVIPVNKGFYKQSVLVSVEPNTKVAKHSHHEPTFRLIIEGSAIINGVEYKAGDWMVVPKDFPYDMETRIGYRALVEYGAKCGSPQITAVTRL